MKPTTVEEAVEVLNRAFAADPEAIRALVSFRVPCNDALADDPTIQVKLIPESGGHCQVGILGILNGIFGVKDDGKGYIAWWPGDPLYKGEGPDPVAGFGVLE